MFVVNFDWFNEIDCCVWLWCDAHGTVFILYGTKIFGCFFFWLRKAKGRMYDAGMEWLLGFGITIFIFVDFLKVFWVKFL